MAYDFETRKLSQKIYYYLTCNGELTEQQESELYKAYVENEDVMHLVKSQGEVADCMIERYANTIYIMPNMGNEQLGFSKAELKRVLCKSGATDRDYYLSQFIILTLLVEFYDGQGSRCKSRDFIKMGELQNIVSERLKNGVQAEEDVERTGLDFQSMSEAFEALKSDQKNSKSKTTKEGVMNSVMDFLAKQNLIVYIKEDEMIKTTLKLDHIMEMKLINRNNYERIMQVLGGEQNEQD